MRIRLLAIILFSVTLATRAEAQFNVPNPAPAENFHVELGLMFWQPTPGIEIQTGGLAAAGFQQSTSFESSGSRTSTSWSSGPS